MEKWHILLGFIFFLLFSFPAHAWEVFNLNPTSDTSSDYYTISYTVPCFVKSWTSSFAGRSGVTYFNNTCTDYTNISFFIETQGINGTTAFGPKEKATTIIAKVSYYITSLSNIDPLRPPTIRIWDDAFTTVAEHNITTAGTWVNETLFGTISEGRKFHASINFDWTNMPPGVTIYIDEFWVATADHEEPRLDFTDEYGKFLCNSTIIMDSSNWDKFGVCVDSLIVNVSNATFKVRGYGLMNTYNPCLVILKNNSLIVRVPMVDNVSASILKNPYKSLTDWGYYGPWVRGGCLIFTKDFMYYSNYYRHTTMGIDCRDIGIIDWIEMTRIRGTWLYSKGSPTNNITFRNYGTWIREWYIPKMYQNWSVFVDMTSYPVDGNEVSFDFRCQYPYSNLKTDWIPLFQWGLKCTPKTICFANKMYSIDMECRVTEIADCGLWGCNLERTACAYGLVGSFCYDNTSIKTVSQNGSVTFTICPIGTFCYQRTPTQASCLTTEQYESERWLKEPINKTAEFIGQYTGWNRTMFLFIVSMLCSVGFAGLITYKIAGVGGTSGLGIIFGIIFLAFLFAFTYVGWVDIIFFIIILILAGILIAWQITKAVFG